MKLLDCTIRDGGYVNNWEFTDEEVKELYKCCSLAGFNYFEIGFRTRIDNKGKGKWFYCDEKDIDNIKNSIDNGCKISIMTRIEEVHLDLDSFLPNDKTNIDLIRVFLTYENEITASGRSGMSLKKLEKCKNILLNLKKLNYKVCLNLGSTNVYDEEDFHNIFKIIINQVEIDYLYFADSYGSILFNDFDKHINNLYNFLKIYKKSNIKLGFHAHNNLGNAYTNFIKCLDSPIDIVDTTMSGLGRGAGNLNSEIVLLHLYKNIDSSKYNVKPLLEYSDKHIFPLRKFYGKYNFGYNNILMICGMYNIHPNYGLELIGDYNLSASECFELLLKLKKKNIENHNFNYDNKLISTLFNKSKNNIKVIFMDYDGTLSNGNVYINKNGEELKTSNTKDGYIIKKLNHKYIFGIISGADLSFFKKRADYLGIKYIFDKVSLNKSKQDIINNILRDLNLEINNLAFIGDDLNDISVIRKCFSGCPSDAQNEIKNESDYICIKKGGEGCVREFIDYINDNNL